MHETIYDKIGQGYNYTRRADPYIAGRLAELLEPKHGGRYLDIGCGTGNYTIALAAMGIDLTGVDPSEVMLAEARSKHGGINWLRGSAEQIPLDSCTMDGAIATLTIHHWTDLNAAFAELGRVLKPGAPMVLFTFLPEQESGYWFNHYFPEMMRRSYKKAVPLAVVTESAAKGGFVLELTENYFVQPDLQDMFGYSGKHDPERYFDPVVRKGISSFAVLADQVEVEEGLRLLRSDIDTGSFAAVKQRYDNNGGDYLFIRLRKGVTSALP